jgi:8-oxo-dGTP diphosphatase
VIVHHGSLTENLADANHKWTGDAISMAPPYCYEYPRPAVTVDIVVFALVGDALKVLLIRRKHDPFAGFWAIPGGFLEIDEPVETAVRRELREETKLDYQGPVAPIGVFAAPGRDPRGRTISLAHATAIRPPLPEVGGADDAAEAGWYGPHEKSPLAFDHGAIMNAALAWLGRDVVEGEAGLALLPLEFGDQAIKELFRALGKTARAAAAWRNRLLREGRIEPVPDQRGRYRTRGG